MENTLDIKKMIIKENIISIDRATKAEVLEDVAEHAISQGYVTDAEVFKKAISEREALMSTGIGFGVAVPHVKIPCIPHFFIIVGLLNLPVDWDALDHKPVEIIFFIGGPDGRQEDYLRILSRIILVIKNEEKFIQLKAARTAEEILVVFLA
jgi:nitrogen PTS system EIIA component